MEFIYENKIIVFLLLGAIIFTLAIYLGVLFKKIKIQEQDKLTLEKKLKERDDFIKESIKTICLATVQGQCELSEACLRLKHLLINYPTLSEDSKYSVIFEMYDEISEFATLEDRKALSKQEIFNQDKKRFQIEKKYESALLESLDSLYKHFKAI